MRSTFYMSLGRSSAWIICISHKLLCERKRKPMPTMFSNESSIALTWNRVCTRSVGVKWDKYMFLGNRSPLKRYYCFTGFLFCSVFKYFFLSVSWLRLLLLPTLLRKLVSVILRITCFFSGELVCSIVVTFVFFLNIKTMLRRGFQWFQLRYFFCLLIIFWSLFTCLPKWFIMQVKVDKDILDLHKQRKQYTSSKKYIT